MIVGLCQSNNNGPMFMLKSLNVPRYRFYINHHNILFATDAVDIKMKTLPVAYDRNHFYSYFFHLRLHLNGFYYCQFTSNNIHGYIGLQGSNLITEKHLERGDSVYINVFNIVAIQDTCMLSTKPVNSTFLNLSKYFVKVEGPGLLYFTNCNNTTSNSFISNKKTRQNLRHMGLLVHLITAIVSLCTVALMLSKLVVEIELQDNNNNNMNNNH